MSTITLTEEELAQLVEKAKLEALAEVVPDLEKVARLTDSLRRYREDNREELAAKALARWRGMTEEEREVALAKKRAYNQRPEVRERQRLWKASKRAQDPEQRAKDREADKRYRDRKRALAQPSSVR